MIQNTEELKWAEFKELIDTYSFNYKELSTSGYYYLTLVANNRIYICNLVKNNDNDIVEYETNYISGADKTFLENKLGKLQIISSSRPPDTTTCFTTKGDIVGEIGGGQSTFWDFSNTDNDITAPTGYKRKKIHITFIDNIWIKEGSFYFNDAKKGSYMNINIVCPNGAYYLKNDKTPALATADTLIYKYVKDHLLFGTCNFGDELNTEDAQETATPPGYIIEIEITVPDTDTDSYGYVEIELYRKRTTIL